NRRPAQTAASPCCVEISYDIYTICQAVNVAVGRKLMRFGIDTGGTFTDLIVDDGSGAGVSIHKAPTTPGDPSQGMLNALRLAAESRNMELREFLSGASTLIHGTTHAINAIITQNTAKTAFLTTEGHRDILVIREGGRSEPF